MSSRGAIAAGHPLTAEAAGLMLEAGGNAYDAALAGFLAACVAEPVLTSLGGGGFMLASTEREQQVVFDFFVQTPRHKRRAEDLDFRPIVADFGTARQEFHIGTGSIATPGAVKGIFAIHRRLASMPIRELVQPAITYARDGVVATPLQAYLFSVIGPIFQHSASSRAIYGASDDPHRMPQAGERLRLPQLADTLEALASEGEDLFYRGEIARLLTGLADHGGHLSLEDLARYQVIERRPLSVDYRGARIHTNPTPASGGLLLAFALRLLEGTDLGAVGLGSRSHLDLLAQAMRLTQKARLDAHLDEATAHPDESHLLDPGMLLQYREQIAARAAAMRGTTHLGVVDARGNVAALSASNGEGCGHVIPQTGIMANNMLGENDLSPHGFHRWQPDQRMTSMMAPSVARLADGRQLATGSGGSKRIRSALLQVLVNMIDFGLAPEPAVEHPRIHYDEGRLSVEPGLAADVIEQLLADYPDHELWDERNLFFGGAHTVMREGGGFDGAGDRRRGGVFRRV